MMKVFSVLSALASILYLHVGFFTYKRNGKSKVTVTFLCLNLVMALWSFSYSFAYTAKNPYSFSFWNKISAFGWCTFCAIILYLVLNLTENKLASHKLLNIIIFIPAFILLYMNLFLFGPNIKTSSTITFLFYNGDFLYNFVYLLSSIFIIYFWGKNSSDRNKKKQSKIIVITASIAFLLNLTTQSILPKLNVTFIPNMGQLYAVIMILGVYYSIIKYDFMQIPSYLITEELLAEIMDLAFIVDSKGNIIKTNKKAEKLSGYTKEELFNSSITNIIRNDEFKNTFSFGNSSKKVLRFNEVNISSKNGDLIPVSLSVSPLIHPEKKILLGILIVGQDLRLLKELQITTEKLANSEEMFRTMVEVMPISVILTRASDNTVLYINNKSEELFNVTKKEALGEVAPTFYHNPEDRTKLINSLEQNKAIKGQEVLFKRKDNSYFLGSISMTPTVYNGQDVLLSSILDITEQKEYERRLKEKSRRDSLTNLYNHQHINDLLSMEIDKANDFNNNLCLMMLDIDFFKKVNDNFGHQTGDKVLVTLTKILKLKVRSIDLIGRYGGEEFIIVLPQIGLEEAYKIADTIKTAVENHKFEENELRITISIGLTDYQEEDAKSLVKRADKLLYQAKEKGRNRIETILSPISTDPNTP